MLHLHLGWFYLNNLNNLVVYLNNLNKKFGSGFFKDFAFFVQSPKTGFDFLSASLTGDNTHVRRNRRENERNEFNC